MEFKWLECNMGLFASTCFAVYHT